MKLIAFAAALLIAACPAIARPKPGTHNDPAVAAWFHDLYNPRRTFPCCDVSDCRRVEATLDDKGTYHATIKREDFDGYEWNQAFGPVETHEVTVPKDAIVIRPDNPTGSSVLCYSLITEQVFCFVPWIFGG